MPIRSYLNGLRNLTALSLLLCYTDAFAIIRRHDRDDARYLELAAQYPAVTRLGGGAATLIAPQWLLTAGHVAANLSPFQKTVRFADRSYTIDGLVEHPQRRARSRMKSVDLALVHLAEPVLGVNPAIPYDKNDEKDRLIVFVGPGQFGDGLSGPIGDDGKMRAASNTVADLLENYVTFKFDAPPEGNDLEGISGPGDSGGPAFLEIEGRTFIIGVSSANDDAGAAGPCRYKSTEYYARVSTAVSWIQATLAAPPPPKAPPVDMIDLADAPWPASRAGRVASAFFDAYKVGTDDAMAAFEKTHRSESALKDRPVEERLQSWRKYRAQWGALKPSKCISENEDTLHVLLRAEGDGVWMIFKFGLEPDAPHKLSGVGIDGPVPAE